ncbi:MAG: metallophosphoesterase [Planctomycetes bacterium]|nr:metallophosphoesterase [Planctomycetota bacterium]
MRALWLTDIHLNFVTAPDLEGFYDDLAAAAPDALLISGDIGEATSVRGFLRQLAERIGVPTYFVLGNHDFYFGSIALVRREVGELCHEIPRLNYLTAEGVVPLAADVGLIGHDGWADAREGDYLRSYVMMNDYRLIAELTGFTKADRRGVLEKLGDEAAAHVRRWLPAALADFPEVVLLTHVPPVRAACWYNGQISDDEWAPHFVCRAVGDAILEIMPKYPRRRLTVLCGHTHSRGECQPLPNVKILTGAAQYGHPAVERVLDFT